MIEINNIQEIEKYLKNIEYDPIRDSTLITYVFQSNGILEDVVFNVDIPFRVDDLIEQSLCEPLKEYCFVTKNITMKKCGGLYKLIANNITTSCICDITHIESTGDVNSHVLSVDSIIANSVTARSLIVGRYHNVKNLAVENLYLPSNT